MIWFSKINSAAFKNWLIATSQGNIKQERLDPFSSSLRVLYNAHQRMEKLVSGVDMGVADTAQFKTDLQSVDLYDKTIDGLSILGKAILNDYRQYDISPEDEDLEIHRSLLLIIDATQSGSRLYINIVNFWKQIRKHFSFQHLISNPEYLFLLSYLNKSSNDYNPFDAITGLHMTDLDISESINWEYIKSYYSNDLGLITAVDKYKSAILQWVARKKGRLNFCTALEIFTNPSSAESIINGLPINEVKKDILKEIIVRLSKNKTMTALNRILYGPPGTGKTHNAINHALSIISGRDVNELINEQRTDPSHRITAKEEFNELIKKGQIQFVTFHQSYSYEDFVEGIKSSVNGDNVEYSIEDGIFKRLCLTASEKKSIVNFDDRYQDFVTLVTESGNSLELETASQKKGFTVRINSKGSCVVTPKTDRSTDMTITKKAIQNYIEDGVVNEWKPYLTVITEYINQQYALEQEDNSLKRYVLIIDEINRGNISKIFGELITLIENSKRIGEPEELRAKLTYSGTESLNDFGVPSNLYIIGTMNSTDKSISLVDTALRRRFEFIEYSSDHTLLSTNIEGINLQLLLQTINSRIEILLDKDHKIGHAYLINVKSKNELCEVFRNKIIPLLEEYFYSDYEKVQLVFGDNPEFNKPKENRVILNKSTSEQKNLFGKEIDGFEDKTIYQINQNLIDQKYSDLSAEFFTSIYTKGSKVI